MSAVVQDVPRWPPYGHRLERWMRFEEWMARRVAAPRWHDVVAEFGCSRASAYRWLAFWRARQWAKGVQE